MLKIPSSAEIRTLLWGAVIFPAGGYLTPILSKFGEHTAEIILKKQSIRLEACAPLKDVRILLKRKVDKGEQIIADQAVEAMNETSVFVQNRSGGAIKDGTLTVYPLPANELKPAIIYSQMAASSVKDSEEYRVERMDAAFRITIPVFNPGDYILIETRFASPIGYIVEMFADGISEKAGFEPGCEGGAYAESTPPRLFFEHYSDRCQKGEKGGPINCQIETSINFEITDEMRGKNLLQEYRLKR